MTNIFPNGVRVLGGLALVFASAACSSNVPPAMNPSDNPSPAAAAASDSRGADAAALLAQIEAARGDDACDSDAQCHTIGVGAKACGGPEHYLAWSSKNNDGSRLRALVEQHAQMRRAADAKAGMMSTCSVVPDPGAVCSAGRCVLREPDAVPGGGDQAR